MSDAITKAKINIAEGTIELEGSEGFVTKYLDEFKKGISTQAIPTSNVRSANTDESHPRKNSANNIKSRSKAKAVKAESFEINPKGSPSLRDFFESKASPASANKRIVVIGYYITKVLNQPFFTEGNVEFAYKVLKLDKRPKFMRQACTDAKNQQQYLDPVDRENEVSAWTVSRVGEIYVEDELQGK